MNQEDRKVNFINSLPASVVRKEPFGALLLDYIMEATITIGSLTDQIKKLNEEMALLKKKISKEVPIGQEEKSDGKADSTLQN